MTDDTEAFQAAEASPVTDIFVPAGVYKLSAIKRGALTKHYFGFGEFVYRATEHDVLVPVENPLTDASAKILEDARSVVFIGDSITDGFSAEGSDDPRGPIASYVDKMQAMLAERSHYPTCDRASFCHLRYEAKTDTNNWGTTGPIHKSLIMSPGASITVAASTSEDFGGALLYMDTDGVAKVFNFGAQGARYIFLEGLSWSLEY